MKMRRIMKENKGYSLVEMIIVIAIIAILTGAAMVTITLINSAKAKEAGVTVDSEISSLVARSKSQIPIFDDGSGSKEHKEYNFALAIYKATDNKYYIAKGFYDSKNNKFNTYDADNTNDGKGVGLSGKVSVSYVPGSRFDGNISDCKIDGDTYAAWVIAYDKSGRCICGVGTYELNKASDNSTIEEISIKANGSHQSR